MDFKQSVKQEVDVKYADMINDKGENPYDTTPNIKSYELYSTKKFNYHNRLKSEKSAFNNSLQKIKQTRQNRLQREENARREKAARQQERKDRIVSTICTLIVLTPMVMLLLWANQMRTAPLSAFEHIHFGWVIAIFIVAFVLYILVMLYYFGSAKPFRGILMLLGSVGFVVLMIVGMTTTDARIIEISSAGEFDAITNLPKASKCSYVLTTDIDFEGKSSKAYGKIKTFTGVFDGNGYYIKNLSVSKESVSYRGANESGATPELMGLVLYNRGEIKNLGFKNCTFEAFISGENTNSFGILAGQNAGQIDNCVFVDTYIKCYHQHDYYSKKYNVLNCDDDFGYIVGRNAIGDRAAYSNTRVYGKITNVDVRFEVENQEFLSKTPSGNYDSEDMYIINDIFGDENISVVDEIGFLE